MNQARLVFTSMVWLLCVRFANAEVPHPEIKHLISYSIWGPVNHPYPVVYLSTRHFETTSDAFLTVLAPHRYNIVSTFTKAQMTRPACMGAPPSVDIWYSVKITARDQKRTRTCILPQALACAYLSDLVKLSGINWSTQELMPIGAFMGEVGCRSASTIGKVKQK